MAKKGNNDFFSSLRTAGIRKRVAKALSELESSGREAGGNAEKLARRAIDDLRAAADAIEKRLNIGSGAKKRSSTRKRTTKRRSPAKKTARKTTARKSTARKAPARKTTARKTTARKSTARKAPARKTTARKSTARKTTARKRS